MNDIDKKDKPHHPHDLLFKKSMEYKIVAVDLFRSYLPKEILSRIDLSTLTQQKESFIEKDIGRGDVDCLYQVEFISSNNDDISENRDHEDKDNNIGKATNNSKNDNESNNIDTEYKVTEIGYIYLLCEQQTKPDRFMAFRLVKYMISIMEYHRKKHKDDKYLPIIYPMVLYTGLKTYNAPTNLLDLFVDKDLANVMIKEFFQLIDINKIEDAKLKDSIYAGTMMYMYKHRANKAIADIIGLIKDNLSVIIKEIGIEYPATMLDYLIGTVDADKIQTKKLIGMFIELANKEEDKEKIMTIADNLRQEGIEKGIVQGLQEGILQGMQEGEQKGMEKGKKEAIEATAINMLKKGFDLNVVNEITGLSEHQLIILKDKSQ